MGLTAQRVPQWFNRKILCTSLKRADTVSPVLLSYGYLFTLSESQQGSVNPNNELWARRSLSGCEKSFRENADHYGEHFRVQCERWCRETCSAQVLILCETEETGSRFPQSRKSNPLARRNSWVHFCKTTIRLNLGYKPSLSNAREGWFDPKVARTTLKLRAHTSLRTL